MNFDRFPEDVREPLWWALEREARKQGSIEVSGAVAIVAATWEHIGIDIRSDTKVCAAIAGRALDHLASEGRLNRLRGGRFLHVEWFPTLESAEHEVSELGMVRRIDTQVLMKTRMDVRGRRSVVLSGKTYDTAKLTHKEAI